MTYAYLSVGLAPMFTRIGLLLFCLLISSTASAAGFGDAEIKSYLGEPLDVRVPLILSDEERKGKFQVTLATRKEYQILEQNIPQSYALLRADVLEDEGFLSVKVSSSQAIDESFLTIILKVQRGRGNFYKKVQLLLDPAWRKLVPFESETANLVSPSNEAFPTKESTPIASEGVQKQAANQPALIALPTSEWARRTSYGPVQSGDNLSEIAYRLRKDKRFSNHQVMLTLFHSNPQAFERNNINILKRGAFLQVPNEASVRAFLQSPSFQDLELVLQQKKKHVNKTKPVAKVLQDETPARKYRSRVSLGMTESLDAPSQTDTSISDAVVLSRLEKLEPLYEQVMASNIRIDGIGGKVDNLAQEVRSLHQKVDALAKAGTSQNTGEKSYGWWWFLLLLVINVLLVIFFLYRRQRARWQEKLEKAQLKNIYAEHDFEPESKKDTSNVDDIMQPMFTDNTLDDDVLPLEELPESDFPVAKHPMDIIDETDVVDKAGSANAWLANETLGFKNIDEKSEKEYVDYPACFEVAMQKQDWQAAEEYYQAMSRSAQTQPRIQASYIQMLHQEERVVDRNAALLSLYETYDQVKWNRFCSLFDDDIWHKLQDERVISFTGEVMAEGVKVSNLKAEEMESLLAISDLDMEATSSQQLLDTKNESKSTQDQDADDFMDKTVVMNAKDLEKWKSDADIVNPSFETKLAGEPEFMDTGDIGKWGKVDETTDDDLMLEVDFDVEEELKEDKSEVEKTAYTEIDIEFTGEIEPLDEEASDKKQK